MALNVLSLFCFSGRIGQWHRFVWLAPYSNFLGSRYGHTAFFPLRLLQGRTKTLLNHNSTVFFKKNFAIMVWKISRQLDKY